ncbi:hypothetical protein [Cognatilysobacter segetis]|uniref:hypothetical protein n=1 Tax=Cognatilysobacter segetis TaxID=2492394 RepID=UPI00105E4E8E|nr:hypothetical protein [Lysobacter segetis]
MQYEIAGVPATLDLPLFTQLITDADPAAVVDLAPGTRTLRMSTVLGTHAVLDALGRTGVDVASTEVDQLPSQCCGGCGG